jgi:hypothetical protein
MMMVFGDWCLAIDKIKTFINTFMEVEIKAEQDEFFKIVKDQTDGSDTPSAQVQVKAKTPAPLENPKGICWFDGTSWGSK